MQEHVLTIFTTTYLEAMPDLVVSDNVNSPGTETSSSCRFSSNQIRVELWVSQILLFHYSQTGLRDVFLVI